MTGKLPEMPSVTIDGQPYHLILMGDQQYREMTQWAWREALEKARKQLANLRFYPSHG